MASTTYNVEGMTCGHCVKAVTEEVSALPGVEAVTVDLVPGGVSHVVVAAAGELAVDDIRAAIAEAGYDLVG